MMTTAAVDRQEAASRAANAGEGLNALRHLQTELLRRVSSASSQRGLLGDLAEIVSRYAPLVAMFYFGRDPQGQLLDAVQLHPTGTDGRTERWLRQLSSACQTACRHGALEVRQQGIPAQVILAAPIVRQGRELEAVGFIFGANASTEHLIMLVQVIASHLVLWHVQAAGRDSEHDATASAALVELLDEVSSASDLRAACFALVAELQSHLNCRRVAVGLRPGRKGSCRLMAISGVAQFDLRSPSAHAIEAAMDDAVLRGELTIWPATGAIPSHGALANKHLCTLDDVRAAVSTPLHDREGVAIGALVVLDDVTDRLTPSQRFLQASERSIATSLGIAMRLEGGRVVRLGRTFARIARKWKAKVVITAFAAAVACLAIPRPYRIHCDCQIEPITRRFIAAPFEGTLENSLAKPGDLVQEGDLLARMDGRETRWQRASVVADQSQAIKKRDAAQASHNYADMQIAALEVERLDLELQLLDDRAEHLEIKSPVKGIVVTGDLERAEGAPLTIGQTLFEIAPLERMVVELAVPDAEISYVRPGQRVAVRLDALPRDTRQSELTKVHPRSEIRNERNVFVAEADLDNTQGLLAPGMKGQATVETERRPLGWILFHKPWEFATKMLRW